MNVTTRTRRTAAAACILAALALAGCSKSPTTPDASRTTPEGVASGQSRLFLSVDLPVTISTWIDKGDNAYVTPGATGTWNPAPADPNGDLFVSQETVYPSGPGVIHGIIVDGTVASAYQVLRRAANGGLEPLFEYPIQPQRKWLESGSELYTFDDAKPSAYSPSSYVARGLIEGVVAKESPVSNTAQLTSTTVAPITVTLPSLSAGVRTPTDSLFTVTWNGVAGAVGYWVEIFEWSANASDDDKRMLGAPAVLVPRLTRDWLVAYCPSTMTSIKVGDPGPEIVSYKPGGFRFGREYNVRISAVDANGHLIAMTLGDSPGDAYVRPATVSGRIVVSPRGAIAVTPTRPRSS